MFLIAQLIGIAVISHYAPQTTKTLSDTGEEINITTHNLPYGLEPPQELTPKSNLISIVISFFVAISLMLILMRYKAELFLRLWFFIVVTLALSVTLNALLSRVEFSAIIAILIALPLSFYKVFKRNLIIHNLTELAIYPGIAAIFVPLLNIPTIVILLVLICIYDMVAVWHIGFMQKMAKYQINKVKVFGGFFVPYMRKEDKEKLAKLKKSQLKNKKIKANVAILGGGDIVFPIILAGVVLNSLGLFSALIITIGATISLGILFFLAEKGKFYPAMPFITLGCFISLIVAYLL